MLKPTTFIIGGDNILSAHDQNGVEITLKANCSENFQIPITAIIIVMNPNKIIGKPIPVNPEETLILEVPILHQGDFNFIITQVMDLEVTGILIS